MQEGFRKGFKLIQGGKSSPSAGFDPSSLLEDRFLRNHYLEGRERSETARQLGPGFPARSFDRGPDSGGFDDFPDAG